MEILVLIGVVLMLIGVEIFLFHGLIELHKEYIKDYYNLPVLAGILLMFGIIIIIPVAVYAISNAALS